MFTCNYQPQELSGSDKQVYDLDLVNMRRSEANINPDGISFLHAVSENRECRSRKLRYELMFPQKSEMQANGDDRIKKRSKCFY